jgi:hypothetical protein
MPVAALFAFKEVSMQKQDYSMLEQQSLFDTPAPKSSHNKFISVFRVSLVKDKQVSFGAEECQLNNSQQACPIFRKLIERQGQSDREQFCVVLLNAKNGIIGLNIVSTGNLKSASVQATLEAMFGFQHLKKLIYHIGQWNRPDIVLEHINCPREQTP